MDRIQEVEKMTEEKVDESKDGMPVKQELFLEAGVHIGTKMRTNDMRDFIFKRRDDGLYILDLRKSADRIMEAAKFVAEFKPEEVTVVASRIYSGNPASRFAALTGVSVIAGRYVPGTMTNIQDKRFIEPKLIIVCDPKGERQAIKESKQTGAKVIGFCDSDNETRNIDLVVPVNNKGKRSLALVFYILTRELMMSQGTIKSYEDFKYNVSYFEQPMEEKKEEETVVEAKQEEPSEEKAGVKEEPKAEAKKADPKEKKAEAKEEKPEAKEVEKKAEAKEEKPKEEKAEDKKKEAKVEKTAPKEEKKVEAKEEKPTKEANSKVEKEEKK
ncbi:30S ribosomal protein S2 [Candidatus Micrarchaeota archaeon]|nr:30S ribosomal protein S2 [Candidatus Micrarchaeota archaeon]